MILIKIMPSFLEHQNYTATKLYRVADLDKHITLAIHLNENSKINAVKDSKIVRHSQ